MLSAAAVAASLTALMADYGETVTLNRSGSTWTPKVVFEPANAAVIATYFDDNFAAGLVRPCLQMLFDATVSGTSNPPQVNDTFTRDGRSFTVERVLFYRLSGTVILITALVD